MPNLTHQRCFNHAARESVARCPACSRFFCRECVTEHEGRVMCAACLKATRQVPLLQRRGLVWSLQIAQCLMGAVLLWFTFYFIGSRLAALPDSFHQGTLWKKAWFEE